MIFGNMVMSFFQGVRQQYEVGKLLRDRHKEKNDAFAVDGFCGQCNTVFGALGCYCFFCPCQESRPILTVEEEPRALKKRELNELRRQFKQKVL